MTEAGGAEEQQVTARAAGAPRSRRAGSESPHAAAEEPVPTRIDVAEAPEADEVQEPVPTRIDVAEAEEAAPIRLDVAEEPEADGVDDELARDSGEAAPAEEVDVGVTDPTAVVVDVGPGEAQKPTKPAVEVDEEPPRPTFSKRLFLILCLVGGLEGADGVLLPCVFLALQRDLGLTLSHLALMNMIQGLAGNFAGPMWGVLADRGTLRRKTIIILGCVVQGAITLALAGVDQLLPMTILRFFNGVMLASLRPIANGIIADVTTDENRGRFFGGMGIAMNAGTMLGALIGTNLARQSVLGVQGWRVAFGLIGGASMILGLAASLIMAEPPRSAAVCSKGKGLGAVKAELYELLSYFRLPSFCVLILQGCFGAVPWNALGFKTLFFQLAGVTDLQASAIDICSQIAGAIGAFAGGAIGDGLSKLSRNHGRPITAQISVLAGIPIAWFIFKQTPPEGYAFGYYLGLMVLLGLTATWCLVGVNLPILAEIVEGDRRATIMAWEGTLEGTCSAFFGNAMVGILAEKVFGYDLANANAEDMASNSKSIQALGSALMMVSLVPWLLCFLCYTLLHWSYKRDLQRVRAAAEAAAAARAAAARTSAKQGSLSMFDGPSDASTDLPPQASTSTLPEGMGGELSLITVGQQPLVAEK